MKKKLIVLATAIFSLSLSAPAFAGTRVLFSNELADDVGDGSNVGIPYYKATFKSGEWKQNATGWWWEDEGGYYPTSADGTVYIDGNGDGLAEEYQFDENGYLITNQKIAFTGQDGETYYNYATTNGWIVSWNVRDEKPSERGTFIGIRADGAANYLVGYNLPSMGYSVE